jgi:plastocyanin
MGKGYFAIVAALVLAFCAQAEAASLTVAVSDQNGRPVADAVVTLIADTKNTAPAPSARLNADKVIDQKNETFLPLVTIVPKGGRVSFANSDQTTHQVYSFSAVKQFEITLPRGQKSEPFAFDNAGVAALGCNIHDHMIAYVFVADSPWTAMSGTSGNVTVNDLPPGAYQMQVWHPRLPPGRQPPATAVTMTNESAKLPVTLKLMTPPSASHRHPGGY